MWSVAMSGVLCPLLGTPVQEKCWETGVGEEYQDDRGLRGKTEGCGLVWVTL